MQKRKVNYLGTALAIGGLWLALSPSARKSAFGFVNRGKDIVANMFGSSGSTVSGTASKVGDKISNVLDKTVSTMKDTSEKAAEVVKENEIVEAVKVAASGNKSDTAVDSKTH